jgi:chorismate mutase
MYFFKFGNRQILGASPELVVRFQIDRTGMFGNRIENFPLAGTTVRGINATEDAELAITLLENEKERAEHMMLVDLGRNDVGRVSKFGTVAVTDLMTIKRYSHVQHIASEIEGEAREDVDAFACIAATCPMGTVTGAPKIEAMKIANHLEKEPRGPYSGEIGYISFNGDCAFCVGLRSFFADGSFAYTQQGGGIVFDSTPEYEYREILRKGAGMTKALQQTVQKSTDKTRSDYTLEELRVKLDDCGARLVRILSTMQQEVAETTALSKNQTTLRHEDAMKEWLASFFHSIAFGLTDTLVQDRFGEITAESDEVSRILNRSYFLHSSDIMEYFSHNQRLSVDDFIMLSSFIDVHNHDVLEILQERFFWIQHVAYYKKEWGISLRKEDREQRIIASVATTLQDAGINPRLAWLIHIYIIFPIAFEIELLIGVKP